MAQARGGFFRAALSAVFATPPAVFARVGAVLLTLKR